MSRRKKKQKLDTEMFSPPIAKELLGKLAATGYDWDIWEQLTDIESLEWNSDYPPVAHDELCLVSWILQKRDPQLSYEFAERAHQAGNHQATCWLGLIYDPSAKWQPPVGIEKNINKSLDYHQEAYARGNMWSGYELGYFYHDNNPPDIETAIKYFTDIWKRGYKPADELLGKIYYDKGKYMLAQIHFTNSWNWKRESSVGFRLAQTFDKLAAITDSGEEQERLYNMSFDLYKQTHEMGCVQSTIGYAECYESGYGVPVDESRAIQLLEPLLQKEDTISKDIMKTIYKVLADLYDDITQKAEMYKRAGENGSLMDLYRFKGLDFRYVQHLDIAPRASDYTRALDAIKSGANPSILKHIPGNIVYEHMKNIMNRASAAIRIGGMNAASSQACKILQA